MILGHRLDVLGANPLAKALFTDLDALPSRDRNLARFVFLDPTAHDLLADGETAARGTVAALRLYAGRHRHDPRLNELVGELSGFGPQRDHCRRQQRQQPQASGCGGVKPSADSFQRIGR
ncbi:hypothetical protein [Nocardia sp. NPDC005998]|uniref:MmyB family transcriptional regulator n=1 Tax=Nocardia sp. NPDC005998 TaxID=3156894 RepID=UPI0033B01AB2